MAKSKNRKNMVIALAMVAVLAIASIAAYFTATDSQTNTFTLGNVKIDQVEDNWDNLPDNDNDGIPDESEDVVPNKEIVKDPKVKNTGINDAYVFTVVAVPKKVVKVSKTATGFGAGNSNSDPAVDAAAQMTQLFQLNAAKDGANNAVTASMFKSGLTTATNTTLGATKDSDTLDIPHAGANNAQAWTGVDSWNEGWYLLDVNDSEHAANSVLKTYTENYNIYLFAYGSADAMTKLKGTRDGNGGQTGTAETTVPVFNSVTIANVVNVNDMIAHNSMTDDEDNINYDSKIEGTMPQMLVKSFAIQADNIQSNGTTPAETVSPAAVWTVLNNQDGAYRAVADELRDLDAANNAWQAAPVDTDDKTVN